MEMNKTLGYHKGNGEHITIQNSCTHIGLVVRLVMAVSIRTNVSISNRTNVGISNLSMPNVLP